MRLIWQKENKEKGGVMKTDTEEKKGIICCQAIKKHTDNDDM